MPHVRTQEYIRPPEEYDLRYVEVIQRHHKVGQPKTGLN